MSFIYIKKKFKKYWRIIIIFLLAISFFLGTSSYNFFTQDEKFIKWSSPDETANYVFAKLYGQTGELVIFEKYNLLVDDIIHPRSFRSDNGHLKPVSFLGIILIYGKLVSFTSYKILPYLTPFFASFGIIFFFLLIKRLFGQNNAFISSFILATFPPYVYYTARSMFHNVLFIVFLIIGLYFSILSMKKIKFKDKYGFLSIFFIALGGLFIGIAITCRISELFWILPMLLIIWTFNVKKIGIAKFFIFVLFLVLAIFPVFYCNQILYLSPINSGYPELNQSILNIANASSGIVKSTVVGELSDNVLFLRNIKDNIFHFGLKPRQSINMFYYYFIDMFFILFYFGLFGLILFLQVINKWRAKHYTYFFALLIVSILLVLYYGSWEFYDNPDKTRHTIGNSYTRYWLPIYLGFIPFMSIFIIRITRLLIPKYNINLQFNANFINIINFDNFKNRILRNIKLPRRKFLINGLKTIIIFIIMVLSIFFVLFGSEEGLYSTVIKQNTARYEYNEIIKLTETNSVLITMYHDKLFFPERKVIVGLFNDGAMNAKYAILASMLPVYYYNFTLPKKDVEYLNNRKLKEVGLKIEKIRQITKDFSLYRLQKIDTYNF